MNKQTSNKHIDALTLFLEGVFTCDEQFDLATKLAANLGYDLVAEKDYTDAKPTHKIKAGDIVDHITDPFKEPLEVVEILSATTNIGEIAIFANGGFWRVSELTKAF